LRLYHLEPAVLLRADNARTRPLMNASFFACDLGQVRCQKLLVIDGHRRDQWSTAGWVPRFVAIETPAQARLKARYYSPGVRAITPAVRTQVVMLEYVMLSPFVAA